MESTIQKIESKYKKKKIIDLRSGDSVRVHQKIVEAGKERVQVFEGTVIKVSRKKSLAASFTVRRIASGIGVEKTFLMHSPAVLKLEVVKRSKVRRNYLTYMRGLRGKGARLSGVDFDKEAINAAGQDQDAEAEEKAIQEKQEQTYDPETAKAEKEAEKAESEGTEEQILKASSEKIGQNPEKKAETKEAAELQNKEK